MITDIPEELRPLVEVMAEGMLTAYARAAESIKMPHLIPDGVCELDQDVAACALFAALAAGWAFTSPKGE